MPTITFLYDDLCSLIGREIPMQRLLESLFPSKFGSVESIVENQISLEVTADRPDLLSVEGVARELQSLLGLEKGLRRFKVARGKVVVNVDPKIRGIRPFISCASIRGIKLTDEAVRQMMQLQEKLHLTYCRNRRKVSIGVHDQDRVLPTLRYDAVKPDEVRFVPLDEEREMTCREVLEQTPKGMEYADIIKGFPRYPLLRDTDGNVLSMPPILNGNLTRVTAETRNLLLDVTGTDERLVNFVLNIMATNLTERGGRIEDTLIIYSGRRVRVPDLKPRKTRLEASFINQMIGLQLKPSQITDLLRRIRYDAKPSGRNMLNVWVPAYRADILHEVDLVEDVAIAYGYDKLKPTPILTPFFGSELPQEVFTRLMRNLMIGLGFQEVLNYTMTSRINLHEKMNLQGNEVVEVDNPVTAEYTVLRSWMLPSLMEFLSYNKHVPYPQKIFECGDYVTIDEAKPTKTTGGKKLAVAICNHKTSYEDIQAPLYSLLNSLGLKWNVTRIEHPSFIPGRVASIKIGGRKVGLLGEIRPQVLNNFQIENPTAAFEIELEEIMKHKPSGTGEH